MFFEIGNLFFQLPDALLSVDTKRKAAMRICAAKAPLHHVSGVREYLRNILDSIVWGKQVTLHLNDGSEIVAAIRSVAAVGSIGPIDESPSSYSIECVLVGGGGRKVVLFIPND